MPGSCVAMATKPAEENHSENFCCNAHQSNYSIIFALGGISLFEVRQIFGVTPLLREPFFFPDFTIIIWSLSTSRESPSMKSSTGVASGPGVLYLLNSFLAD